MSKQVLIDLLRKGNTGSEILSILDTLTDTVSDSQQADNPSPGFIMANGVEVIF